jgi:hypothetical protein
VPGISRLPVARSARTFWDKPEQNGSYNLTLVGEENRIFKMPVTESNKAEKWRKIDFASGKQVKKESSAIGLTAHDMSL